MNVDTSLIYVRTTVCFQDSVERRRACQHGGVQIVRKNTFGFLGEISSRGTRKDLKSLTRGSMDLFRLPNSHDAYIVEWNFYRTCCVTGVFLTNVRRTRVSLDRRIAFGERRHPNLVYSFFSFHSTAPNLVPESSDRGFAILRCRGTVRLRGNSRLTWWHARANYESNAIVRTMLSERDRRRRTRVHGRTGAGLIASCEMRWEESDKMVDVLNISEIHNICRLPEELDTLEDPRTPTLRRVSYGIVLPAICCLGIIGNILNLVVLTRRNMRGTAYIYMRGEIYIYLSLYLYVLREFVSPRHFSAPKILFMY